jgi:exodeoxyribonuclease-3
MRIDLLLASPSLAKRAQWALIDRNARKGTLPSDHAPLLVDFDDRG